MSPNREILIGRNQKLKPSWKTYHDLGVKLMPLIPTHSTLEEIGLRRPQSARPRFDPLLHADQDGDPALADAGRPG